MDEGIVLHNMKKGALVKYFKVSPDIPLERPNKTTRIPS
jgi:hypothetical protein